MQNTEPLGLARVVAPRGLCNGVGERLSANEATKPACKATMPRAAQTNTILEQYCGSPITARVRKTGHVAPQRCAQRAEWSAAAGESIHPLSVKNTMPLESIVTLFGPCSA